MARRPTNNEYYVDKEAFYNEIVRYKAMPEGSQIPNSIGIVFMNMARKFASRGNFRGYSFVEELIDDAIENQIYALKFFDPEKSNNPFGYFSQVILFAFIRRIQLEKKQQYIKHKNFFQTFIEGADMSDIPNIHSLEVIEKFEKGLEDAKQRKKTGEKSKFRLF